MDSITVGIREFRDNLETYVLDSDTPVAVTCEGKTVGYFIPARRKRSEAEQAALQEAAARLEASLAAEGVTEDEVIANFERWRAAKRR